MEFSSKVMSRIIADNLLRLRRRKGGTQKTLSSELGWPKSTLTLIESGLGNPSMASIVQLAKYYQVSLDELVLDPFDRKRVAYRKGLVIDGSLSGETTVRQVLSHQSQIRLREFTIPESAQIRLKGKEQNWKELLICDRGYVSVSGFASSETLKDGEFLELVPYNNKQIWSLKGQAKVRLLQIKN